MSLWRQQYPHLLQSVRCQVETRWQTVHHKGQPPGGGLDLSQGWGAHVWCQHTALVSEWWLAFLSLYCVLASTDVAHNPGCSYCFPSECHSLEPIPVTYLSTTA